MAEVVFSVAIFVAEFHAAGLVVSEAGAAGDFEILALTGCPHFNVVGLL